MKHTVLVTGGAKRVGRSLCLGLAEVGYATAVHYNGSRSAAETVVDEIKANGGTAISVQANLEVETDARGLCRQGAPAGRPFRRSDQQCIPV